MGEFDLSGFAGDVESGLAASSPGVETAFPQPSVSAPAIQSPSFFDRASDIVGKVGGGLEKEVESSPLKAFSSALGLGGAGFNIANQMKLGSSIQHQTSNIEKQQKAAQAAAAPAVQFGTEQLQAAGKGQLPAPMEAAVQQWVQQAKADMRARLASMGLGNSTDIQGEESKIDLMAQSMRAQLLQGQEGVALEGLKTGVSASNAGAATSGQQQQLLTSLIEGANQQLAKLGASTA